MVRFGSLCVQLFTVVSSWHAKVSARMSPRTRSSWVASGIENWMWNMWTGPTGRLKRWTQIQRRKDGNLAGKLLPQKIWESHETKRKIQPINSINSINSNYKLIQVGHILVCPCVMSLGADLRAENAPKRLDDEIPTDPRKKLADPTG